MEVEARAREMRGSCDGQQGVTSDQVECSYWGKKQDRGTYLEMLSHLTVTVVLLLMIFGPTTSAAAVPAARIATRIVTDFMFSEG